jgi:hypothetical protein
VDEAGELTLDRNAVRNHGRAEVEHQNFDGGRGGEPSDLDRRRRQVNAQRGGLELEIGWGLAERPQLFPLGIGREQAFGVGKVDRKGDIEHE